MGKFFTLCCAVFFMGAGEGPKRIVSLAPSVTEGIYLLGSGERLAGVTIYCDRPPEAKRKEKIGTLLEPDAEKIVSLGPDLVLGTQDGNDPNAAERLRALGLKVDLIPSSNSFLDLCGNFLLLGRLIGREEKAGEMLNEARKRVGRVQKKLRGLPKKKVFWEVGARPLVTTGGGGYLDDMTVLAGGENIAHKEKGAWLRYSREEVVRRNPDVIILVGMGDVGEDEIRTWSRYKGIIAVKENRFLVLGPEATAPLPADFVAGLEALARFLHPEAFAGGK